MLSILTDEAAAARNLPEPKVVPAEPTREPTAETKSEEFEIVLQSRQVASVLFVATVVLVVISAVAYLAGKASSPKKVEIAAAAQPVPMLQATITKAPTPTVDPKPASVPEPPIFAEPVN